MKRKIHKLALRGYALLRARPEVKGGAWLASAFAIALVFRWLSPWYLPSGAWVDYYPDIESQGQRLACRPIIQLHTAMKSPWNVPDEKYGAIIRGWLWVPETREYAFASRSDDGLRVTIDGQLILESWKIQSSWEESIARGSARLKRGWRQLEVHYFNHEGSGALRVDWAGGEIPRSAVIKSPYLWKYRVPWKR